MEDPQVFDELRLNLMTAIQDPLIHPANDMARVIAWFFFFLFFFFFFWCLGTSSPELSMEELRCRFFGDEEGEVVAAATGGDGLMGGASNGSGGGSLL